MTFLLQLKLKQIFLNQTFLFNIIVLLEGNSPTFVPELLSFLGKFLWLTWCD